MKLLPQSSFLMGSEGRGFVPGDGEGPIRRVALNAFWIDECAVTGREFEARSAAATGYMTEAEKFWLVVCACEPVVG